MEIEILEWDSEFFGKKIGRLIILHDNEFNPVHFKDLVNEGNYCLVYIIKYQTILDNEKIIKAGLDLVDIQILMSKKIVTDEYLNIPYDFRTQLTESERTQCYEIAEQTSSVSRFNKEDLIGSKRTKDLYRKWIDNALNKTYSDGLFLHKRLDKVVGIHLVKSDTENKIGYFTLTGISPILKRQGIGKKLWDQSFCYFSTEKKIDLIKSPFSFQNTESFNFHLKMGFSKVDEVKYIYHYRNIFK